MTDNERDMIENKSAKNLVEYLINIAEIRGDCACIFLNDDYRMILEKVDKN